MHYQAAPREESKVVRCTQGAVFDVLLDLRPDSPTYCHWAAEQLSAHNHRMVYVPRGVAHGFQTLTDNAEVFYQISQVYDGDLSRGVRWNDPAFEIDWPEGVNMISERDRLYPDYKR